MDRRTGLGLGILMAAVLLLAGCSTQQGAGGAQLEGTLVSPCGTPLAYKTVYIPGHDPVLTDAEGRFVFDDVQTPYDLVIANAYLLSDWELQEVPVLVYKGMTSLTPEVAAVPAGEGPAAGCSDAVVKGSVYSAAGGEVYGVGAVSSHAFDTYRQTWTPPASEGDPGGYYDLEFSFAPGTSAALTGVLWSSDDETGAVSYVSGVHQTITPADGETTTQDLALQPIGTRSLTVSVELPDGVAIDKIEHRVAAGGQDTGIETRHLYSDDADASGHWILAGPVGQDLGSLLFAQGYYGVSPKSTSAAVQVIGNITFVMGWTLAGDDGAVSVSLPRPTVPMTPLSGGTARPGSVFRWSGSEGATYDVIFIFRQSGPDLSVEVVTSDTSMTLPDLGGAGILYDNIYSGYWEIYSWEGSGLPAGVEAAASLEGVRSLRMLIRGLTVGDSGSATYTMAGSFDFAASSDQE